MIWEFGARRVRTFGMGGPLVWMISDFDLAEQAAARLPEGAATIAAVEGVDWDRELTPWPAPPVARGRPDFGGEADALIAALFEAAIPEVEAALRPAARWIAGYSLAGLFAAYAAIATGRFARAASVSGSMWYPGFADWARARLAQRPPSGLERAYFSVGDRERFGRNPSFRSVEDGARRVAGDLARAGAQTKFETRPGGHFCDAAGRVARALEWLAEAPPRGAV